VNHGQNVVKVRILLEICVRSSLEPRRKHCLSYWSIRARTVKLCGMSCEMSAILSGCNKNRNMSSDLSQKSRRREILRESVLWGSCRSVRRNRRRDSA